MDRFLAAACQLAAGSDPRQAVLKATKAGARLAVLPAFALQARAGSSLEPGDREALLAEAQAIAREAGCYLVPGTALVADAGRPGGGARQVSWLIGPDGQLLGEQAQTHTTREEEAAGWLAASELSVFKAGRLGVRVGLLVGLDVWVPEVSRILALQGAELLVAPLAMPAPYSEPRQVAGVWQEVQQNQTVAIEACLVGDWDGRRYAGRSAVTGPCEMVPDASGFSSRAGQPETPLTLLGAVDLAARRQVVAAYDILAELNTDLYQRALPQLYLAPSGWTVGVDPEPGPPAPLPLRLKEKAFRAYLTHAARPGVVRRAVESLRLRPGAGSEQAGRRVKVAALQVQSFYAKSAREYVERLGEHFAEAIATGASLVAFPELVSIPLIGLLPGVEATAEKKAPAPRLGDIVRFMEPVLRSVYFTFFSGIAAAAQVWVMAGSTPIPEPDGRVYNTGFLFAPDGRLAGMQRKLHLFPRERDEGLSPGSRLEVFETPVGRLALPVCMDATYFETYRLAALLGAEIVAAPVTNVEPYDYWKLLRGAWPRTQETPVFAVQSTLVGDFLGDPMTGKASIFGPAELTSDGSGVVAQCPQAVSRGLAVGELDLDALAAFRARDSVMARLNPEVIRRYLPAIYAGREKGEPR